MPLGYIRRSITVSYCCQFLKGQHTRDYPFLSSGVICVFPKHKLIPAFERLWSFRKALRDWLLGQSPILGIFYLTFPAYIAYWTPTVIAQPPSCHLTPRAAPRRRSSTPSCHLTARLYQEDIFTTTIRKFCPYSFSPRQGHLPMLVLSKTSAPFNTLFLIIFCIFLFF